MTGTELAGKRVLVTGGAGFIGSHLVDRLVGSNEMVVLDDLSAGRREWVDDRATFIEGDVRDESTVVEAMDSVDVMFHEAANISVERSVDAPIASHGRNVDATLNVLEAARDADATVVLASSAAIYGFPERVPVQESDRKNPTSPYGLEKLSVDHYARLYHDLYGLDTVALRYFNVYGPRHGGGSYSGVIDIFLDQAQSGGPITVDGDGEQTRDFVHVQDVVDANVQAACNATRGEAYNVANAEETTIRELAETIRELTDSGADIEHVAARPGDIEHSRASIQKARDDFGYEPTTALTDGLETLIADR